MIGFALLFNVLKQRFELFVLRLKKLDGRLRDSFDVFLVLLELLIDLVGRQHQLKRIGNLLGLLFVELDSAVAQIDQQLVSQLLRIGHVLGDLKLKLQGPRLVVHRLLELLEGFLLLAQLKRHLFGGDQLLQRLRDLELLRVGELERVVLNVLHDFKRGLLRVGQFLALLRLKHQRAGAIMNALNELFVGFNLLLSLFADRLRLRLGCVFGRVVLSFDSLCAIVSSIENALCRLINLDPRSFSVSNHLPADRCSLFKVARQNCLRLVIEPDDFVDHLGDHILDVHANRNHGLKRHSDGFLHNLERLGALRSVVHLAR